MNFTDNLDKIVTKYNELSERLSSGITGDTYVAASKEFAELEPIVLTIQKYLDAKKNLLEAEEIINSENKKKDADRDLLELAQTEYDKISQVIDKLEFDVKIALLPKDEADKRNAIIEIRAGTGGDEAALFASVLFNMYQRYSQLKGWKFEILSLSDIGIGGYKEASALISGNGVFSRLKFESGVHRVQRIPETESNGRIHTSAATVAVLPEAEEVDLKIDEKDLRIDTYRSSGAGGQHVNTTDSAVRITHIPTGTVVCMQDERSQQKNKAKAMKVLLSRIFDNERLKKDQERSSTRKGQVGSGDRSERIRTYNYPQGRVSDHRINLTLYKIEAVTQNGELDEFIDSLISNDEANRLAEAVNE